jgi:uncharacterized membrane protein (DUF106 family)
MVVRGKKIDFGHPVVKTAIVAIVSVLGFIGSFMFYRVYDMPQIYETRKHNQEMHDKQDMAQKRIEDKFDKKMDRISDQIGEINRYLRDKLK